MHGYYLILNAPKEKPVKIPDIRSEIIKAIIKKAQQEKRTVLTIDEAISIAEASNIPIPKAAVARSIEEAVKIASEIGYPLTMKVVSPEIIHKTDVSGPIILNIKTSEEEKKVYEEIIRNKLFMSQAKILGVFYKK
jgi:acyl-CoA synthetase (NDP forming)